MSFGFWDIGYDLMVDKRNIKAFMYFGLFGFGYTFTFTLHCSILRKE